MTSLKKDLGQVDTPIQLAKVLVENLDCEFDNFADIGIGLGNLSISIQNKAGVGVEVDKDRIKYLKRVKQDKLKLIEADFLQNDFNLNKILEVDRTLFISNPPFHRARSGHVFKRFTSIGQYHQLDIAFLDKTLDYLRDASSLLFIMSSPFIEFQSHRSLREIFIKEFAHIEVISLSDDTYKDTEVESYAVIGYKVKKPFRAKYSLSKMNNDGIIIDEIEISEEYAIESLSFNFHKKKNELLARIGKSDRLIRDLILDIRRGSRTKKQFNEIGLQAIHTSDLTNSDLSFEKNNTHSHLSFNLACENDILVSRVGKRSLTREAIIRDGNNYFTDSVFKITSNNTRDNDIVWSNISSDIGKMWRQVHSQGKCAKYLTSTSIINMPVHC